MFYFLFVSQISSLLFSVQTLSFFLNIRELKRYTQPSVVSNALRTMEVNGWSASNLDTCTKIMCDSFGAQNIHVQMVKAWDPNNEKFLWFGLTAFAIFGITTFAIFWSLKNSHGETLGFLPSCEIDLNFTGEHLSMYYQGLLGFLNPQMIASLLSLLVFSWIFLLCLRLQHCNKEIFQHKKSRLG